MSALAQSIEALLTVLFIVSEPGSSNNYQVCISQWRNTMRTRFRRHLKLGRLVVPMILLGTTGTLIGTTGVLDSVGVLASAGTACGCAAGPAGVASVIGSVKPYAHFRWQALRVK